MHKSFSLLDEEWMPVRFVDGTVARLGLVEAFARSREIVALAETAPPSLVAQYRLLLVIVHRALVQARGRRENEDRADWHAEGLPLSDIHAYLAHWRDRFWLFHPEAPFLQVAALATAAETRDKRKPWTQIALASANGNTPVVFRPRLGWRSGRDHRCRCHMHFAGLSPVHARRPGQVIARRRQGRRTCQHRCRRSFGSELGEYLVPGLAPGADCPCRSGSPGMGA